MELSQKKCVAGSVCLPWMHPIYQFPLLQLVLLLFHGTRYWRTWMFLLIYLFWYNSNPSIQFNHFYTSTKPISRSTDPRWTWKDSQWTVQTSNLTSQKRSQRTKQKKLNRIVRKEITQWHSHLSGVGPRNPTVTKHPTLPANST